MIYHELNLEKQTSTQADLLQSLGLHEIARRIKNCRIVCRPKRKLLPDSEIFSLVKEMLRDHFFSERIADNLRYMLPKLKETYVSQETIYNVIYALLVGELRKELSTAYTTTKTTRRPRQRGNNKTSTV